jgi:hypothetical protein
LNFANNKKFYSDLCESDEKFETEVILRELKKKRFHVDILLGLILAYYHNSHKDTASYEIFKDQLLQIGPFFEMTFDVLEDEEKFEVKSTIIFADLNVVSKKATRRMETFKVTLKAFFSLYF